MFKFRMIGPILRATGLGHATLVFAAVFLLCAGVIALFDSEIAGQGNVLWFCFQAVTTIGFGDVVATSAVSRIATVVLSLFSIFYLAMVTGAVVGVCSEMMKARRNESVAAFQDKLEHLSDLSPAELEELSAQIKAFRLNQ